jgi:hypothetical protein
VLTYRVLRFRIGAELKAERVFFPKAACSRKPGEVAMKFSNLLTEAIGQSEIPLRFEPGAEEAVAAPIIALLKSWVAAHEPGKAAGDFELGQKALVVQLLNELDDRLDLPGSESE